MAVKIGIIGFGFVLFVMGNECLPATSCPASIKHLAQKAAILMVGTRFAAKDQIPSISVKTQQLTKVQRIGPGGRSEGKDGGIIYAFSHRVAVTEEIERDSAVEVAILSPTSGRDKGAIFIITSLDNRKADPALTEIPEDDLLKSVHDAVAALLSLNHENFPHGYPKKIQRTEGSRGSGGVFQMKIPVPTAILPLHSGPNAATKFHCLVTVDITKRQFIREIKVVD